MRRREEANKRSVYGNQWAASTDEWGSDFVQLAAFAGNALMLKKLQVSRRQSRALRELPQALLPTARRCTPAIRGDV
jgi:hypothetical protein